MLQQHSAPATPVVCRGPSSLRLADRLFTQLDAQRIRYCHWKSNESLRHALSGAGDLDLLVAQQDQQSFQALLLQLGFRCASQVAWQRQPGVFHFYGLDDRSEKLLHLHVYFVLVTGGQLLKNYRLPFESALLERRGKLHGVSIPRREVELAVLVLRKLLEAGNLFELVLLWRDRSHVAREIRWLLSGNADEQASRLDVACRHLHRYAPSVDGRTWRRGAEALCRPGSAVRLFLLGRVIRRALRGQMLQRSLPAALRTCARFCRRIAHRFGGASATKWPAVGGRVIAVIGPEASGKSTVCASIRDWLAGTLRVRVEHLGKPTVSLTGRLANLARRLRRVMRPGATSGITRPARAPRCPSSSPSLGYAIASVLLARDRLRAATAAHRAASRGTIVICDRYPNREPGAVDGPRLSTTHKLGARPFLIRTLTRFESNLYQRMPDPDVTIQLDVPLAVSQQRNRDRVKPDKEDDLRMESRYLQFHGVRPEHKNVHHVNTARRRADAVREVKRVVWENL